MALSTLARQWLIPVTVGAGLVVGFSLGKAAGVQADRPPVHVSVTQPEDANGIITVTVRNDGSKAIEEWGVSAVFPDGMMITRSETEPPDKLFAPKETRTVRLGARGSRDLRVSVIFEDRTAAGEEEILSTYFAGRERQRDQLIAWIRQLRDVLAGSSITPDEIQSRLASFDRDDVDGLVKFHAKTVRATLSQTSSEAAKRDQLKATLTISERDLEKARVAAVRRR